MNTVTVQEDHKFDLPQGWDSGKSHCGEIGLYHWMHMTSGRDSSQSPDIELAYSETKALPFGGIDSLLQP